MRVILMRSSEFRGRNLLRLLTVAQRTQIRAEPAVADAQTLGSGNIHSAREAEEHSNANGFKSKPKTTTALLESGTDCSELFNFDDANRSRPRARHGGGEFPQNNP